MKAVHLEDSEEVARCAIALKKEICYNDSVIKIVLFDIIVLSDILMSYFKELVIDNRYLQAYNDGR